MSSVAPSIPISSAAAVTSTSTTAGAATTTPSFILHEERDFYPSSLYVVFLYVDNALPFPLHSALFFASPDVRLPALSPAGRIWHATRGGTNTTATTNGHSSSGMTVAMSTSPTYRENNHNHNYNYNYSNNHPPSSDWLYEETTAAEISLRNRLILAVRIADLSDLGSYQDVANSVEKVVSNYSQQSSSSSSSMGRGAAPSYVYSRMGNGRYPYPPAPPSHHHHHYHRHPHRYHQYHHHREWVLGAILALHETAYLYCPSLEKLDAELERLVQFAVPKHLEERRHVIAVSDHCAADEADEG